MANNFLILGALSGLAWLLVSGLAPSAHSADSASSATSNANRPFGFDAGNASGSRSPCAKNPIDTSGARSCCRTSYSVAPLAVEPTIGSEPAVPTAPEQLDSKAAKAAVEVDGYKRVTVLGKGPNGAWRAKGLRGATEVLLTVDGTGR